MSKHLLTSIDNVKASGLFTPVRIAEIEAAAEANRKPLCFPDGSPTGLEAYTARGGRVFVINPNGPDDHYNRLLWSAEMTDEEIDLVNNRAHQIIQEQQEQDDFRKADKVPESEYSGWVVIGDIYAESAEELKNRILGMWNVGDELPEYAWAAAPEVVIESISVDEIFESQMCDRGWEDMSADDLNGVEDLQKAIDDFVDKNTGVVAYHENRKLAVILDWSDYTDRVGKEKQ